MKIINIELSFDDRRPQYAYFTIHQLLNTLADGYKINFYLITKNITDYSMMDRLKEEFPIKLNKWYTVDFTKYIQDIRFKKIKYDCEWTYWTDIVMARMYLWDMFPNLKRFIHIDDDVLIMKSISEMWEFDKSSPLLATKTTRMWMADKAECEKYNITDWFNGGCWRLDLEYFREHDMYNKALQCVEENHIDNIVDERIMNILYWGIYTSADDNRFNYIPVLGLQSDSIYNISKPTWYDETMYCTKDDVTVVHWATGDEHGKPWKVTFSKDIYGQIWKARYREYCIKYDSDDWLNTVDAFQKIQYTFKNRINSKNKTKFNESI